MTGRSCRDCGRRLGGADVPADVTLQVRATLESARRVCLWCFDRNLLAGGYEAPRLRDRWDADQLAQLRAEAAELRAERQMHWRQRKLRPERAQGRFGEAA